LPGNVGLVFGIIIPFIMFDIIEPEYFEYVFTFDPDAQDALSHLIIGQMQDLGYENHNALFNLGTMAIFSILYLVRV